MTDGKIPVPAFLQNLSFKGALEAIGKYGVPPVLALWLVYLLGQNVASDLQSVRRTTQATHQLLIEHIQTGNSMHDMQRAIVNLTLQQCANLAATRAERDACFQALYRQPSRDE